MSEKQTSKERLKDITDSIEKEIQELFQSDKYAQYLRTMSRFHKYSVNNTMLIYMQRPDATLVAGFNKWRDQFERNVKKGEKGIKIIAPTPFKKKIEEQKLDPDTKQPMLDADGKVIMEEKEIKIPMFKPVTVFDVSQTDGKPLPQLASDLSGNVQNYEIFMEALQRASPVPIDFKPLQDGSDGFFSLDSQSITIRDGMSEVQTVSAVVHEIAHSKLHNEKNEPAPPNATKYQEIEIFDIPGLFSNGRIDAADIPEGLYRYDLRGSDYDPGDPVTVEERVVVNHAGSILTAKPLDIPEGGALRLTEDEGLNFVGGEITAYQFKAEQKKDRNTEEVEAESISFAVCAYYGIATGENSFGYIATWSKDKELKELRASLETINKTSSELISDIDRHYAEIMKEREADLTLTEPVLQTPTEEALYLVDDAVYLHVQPTDGGWDYSLYDKESKKLLDGGVIETAAIEESPVSSIAGAVRTEVFVIQGMTPTSVVFEDIAILEDLQAAQIPEATPIESEAPTTEAADSIDAIARSVQEEEPMQAPDNGYMPDPSMSIEAMNAYGYTDSDMLPLSKERALELFERDVPIYMLYEGNTEAMAFETEDIVLFSGCFGITREDWDAIKDQIPPMDMETIRQKREQAFLESPGDTYAIYQLKRDDATADLRFMNSEWLNKKGIEPQPENYDLIYTGALYPASTQIDTLERLYQTFNLDHPADFTGHSLSVSDIVALKQNGVVSCHYVDSVGYKELPSFIQSGNYLKNAEMQMEDDYGMIDGIVNNGPRQTEPPAKAAPEKKADAKAKKPSVLAKLRQYQDEDRKATTMHRSAERDL
ncbi:MAG: DUF4316 domain-containing protein [Bacteroidales bacterium]|nr:DUF4316 domain-containing protein [Bacteroidales bacterium]